jgi:hypothetical protein
MIKMFFITKFTLCFTFFFQIGLFINTHVVINHSMSPASSLNSLNRCSCRDQVIAHVLEVCHSVVGSRRRAVDIGCAGQVGQVVGGSYCRCASIGGTGCCHREESTGSVEDNRRLLELGCMVGIGGCNLWLCLDLGTNY